jgi:hypothetical protein
MSLPRRPWTEAQILALRTKSLLLLNTAIKPYNYRRMKRSYRIAERVAALWFQLKKLDPHSTTEGPRR